MIRPEQETRLGCLLFGGLGLAILSLFAFIAMSMVGLVVAVSPVGGDARGILYALLPVLGVVSGLLMMGYSLYQTWWIPRKAAAEVTIKVESGVYVVSKFALNEHGNMEFPFEPVTDQELRYFVQLQYANGRRAEVRTSEQTYFTVGEGMSGVAKMQGDWLGQFHPTPKSVEEGPYR